PLDVVFGDVLDPASLAGAMAGCSTAYHLGASADSPPDLPRVIVEGTRNVLDQGQEAGLRRLVYCSSVVTVGYSENPAVVFDESSYRPSAATAFDVAQWQAEQLVLNRWRQTGWPVVVVNPATVVGSLDFRGTPGNAPLPRGPGPGRPLPL